jgi:hypothetical protein
MKILAAIFLSAAMIVGGGAALLASDVSKVENIGPNATSEGDAYRVTCSSGTSYVLERRKGEWHQGTVLSGLGLSSSKSIDEVAKTYCGRM